MKTELNEVEINGVTYVKKGEIKHRVTDIQVVYNNFIIKREEV